MRVACIGEAMVELSLAPDGTTAQVGFAGDTLNTAIYLKRAAPEIEVAYVTRLGVDGFSEALASRIAAEAISTAAIERSKTCNVGLYAITTDAAGERAFTYWRSASAARDLFQAPGGLDFSALAAFDMLYVSAITLAILPDAVRAGLLAWLATYRGQVAFDSNFRPALWEDAGVARTRIAEAWARCDIGLPSVDDEQAIFGDRSEADVVARLQGLGVRDGALKCGPAGPVSLGTKVEQGYPRAKKVVDTTAAGDSFNGAYLAARLRGDNQAVCLRAGHACAAHVVAHRGAIVPWP